MGIVIQMRCTKPLISALLVTLIAIGAPSLATATSVTDQYTEHVPGPGGSEISKPGETGQNGSGSDASVPAQTGSDPDGDEAGAVPFGQPGGGDGSGSAAGAVTGAGESADSSNPGSMTASGLETSNGAVTSSGDDGMGWFFPAGITLIAAAIVIFAIKQRNRVTRTI